MAIFIPPVPFDFHGSQGEEEVFEALKNLPDSIYIFHSLRWVGHSARSAVQGEADFVIFDPQRGLMIIEVKSGKITCTSERRWFQKNRASGDTREIEDPEIQASRSKFELIHALDGKLSQGEKCLVCHAVWFPSGPVPKTNLPLNYAPEFTLNSSALDSPEEAIRKAFDYWCGEIFPTKLKTNGIQRVLELIAPILSIVPSLRYDFEARDRQFIQLTNEQARVIEFLDEQKTAVISGIAGTGKTVLAVEKARRLAAQGGRVLVVFYNSALKNWLRENCQITNVTFDNFHSLAASYIGFKEGDFDGMANDFLEYLSNDDNPWEYEHTIIDEGQDFKDDWVDFLHLRTPGHFYVFYDPYQTVHTENPPKWIYDAECRLVLKRNCRNTAQIHRTACRFLNLKTERIFGSVEGSKPYLWEITDENSLIKLIREILFSLFSKEIRAGEVAILTLRTTGKSALAGTDRIEKWPLQSELTDEAICYTTVRKFKGLEANVVLLVDVRLAELENEDIRKLLYLGASRAKHELHILLSAVNDDSIENAIKGLASDRRVPKTRKGFARLIDAHWMSVCEEGRVNASDTN